MAIDYSHAPHAWEKERGNFVLLLDLQLESVERGKAVMRMPFRPEITNGTGAVHGGAIVSLCDTVFYVALASIYGREQDTTTASLQCNFLAPATAAARSDRRGARAQGRPPHRLRRSLRAQRRKDRRARDPELPQQLSAREARDSGERADRRRVQTLRRTALYDEHARSGARLVPFARVRNAGAVRRHSARARRRAQRAPASSISRTWGSSC